MYLGSDDLKELGIPLGPRKHILHLLGSESAAAPPLPPPSPASAKKQQENPIGDFEKYIVQPKTIRLGKPEEAALGLLELMGIGNQELSVFLADPEGSIIKEFTNGSDADQLNLRKVLEGSFDDGHTIDGLMNHPSAVKARLGREHLLALRMYTTQSYGCFNEPMRKSPPTRPHPFAASAYFASEAIKKLRAVGATHAMANKKMILWRGMKDMALSFDFLASGGTEFACMSTSSSETIAAKFALSKCPLIFKFESSSFMSRGADIAFLSVYPAESEYLYPPLTYLRAIGAQQEMVAGVQMLVATVEPVFS